MSTSSRAHEAQEPTTGFSNYCLLGPALRGVPAAEVVAASPYR